MSKVKHWFLIISLVILAAQGKTQSLFPAEEEIFNDNFVPRIDIFIDQDSLDYILEPGNEESDHEFPATFIFTSPVFIDTVYNVGFRLRGNTSRYSDKKSFKVSFNSFEDKKFFGLEKLNLNGEHNDPSIIRAKLCWNIFRDFQVPGSRSNHVRLYINNQYRGLYINVEHVDEEFVALRFGNKDGNLYKCLWPADLVYIDNNPDSYKFDQNGRRAYDLKTNTSEDNYEDLAELINVINNTPINSLREILEPIFNVESYLRNLAVEVFTGHWDAYSVNKNNFYLYKNTSTGKFEYIPYDPDNTFGIDWFGIDWALRDINDWANNWEERPLTKRLLEVPEYHARYNFYFKTLLEEIVKPTILNPTINSLKSMISPYVIDDPFHSQDYGWDYNDFLDSYNDDLGGHVTYGLFPYIEARFNSALAQLDQTNISPIITNVKNNLPSSNQQIRVAANIVDDQSINNVTLHYRINSGTWNTLELFDDGMHADIFSNDDIYSNTLAPLNQTATINYFIEASDNSNKTSREPITGYYTFNVYESLGIPLYINEFMASNQGILYDEYGESDDWVEIYNGGSSPIHLADIYLSDNPDSLKKWNFPNEVIQSGEFRIIWTDNDPIQGSFHTNFKLNKFGEALSLFKDDGSTSGLIDIVYYQGQTTNKTQGRIPDGTGPVIELGIPTPGYSNNTATIPKLDPLNNIRIFPNPAADYIHVELIDPKIPLGDIILYDQLGRPQTVITRLDRSLISIDVTHLSAGIYYLVYCTRGNMSSLQVSRHKIIIL